MARVDDGAFYVKTIVPPQTPPEGRKHLLEATRQKVGDKIFEILWTNKLPAVIDLEENILHEYSENYPVERVDVIEYRVTVTNVMYRNVEVARMSDLDLGYYQEPNFQERVTRWIKKVVSRLSNWRSRLLS